LGRIDRRGIVLVSVWSRDDVKERRHADSDLEAVSRHGIDYVDRIGRRTSCPALVSRDSPQRIPAISTDASADAVFTDSRHERNSRASRGCQCPSAHAACRRPFHATPERNLQEVKLSFGLPPTSISACRHFYPSVLGYHQGDAP
jgi:hypothetical protein